MSANRIQEDKFNELVLTFLIFHLPMVPVFLTLIGISCAVAALWPIHELGHWLAARHLGYNATISVKRWFLASMSVTIIVDKGISKRHDIIITLAGPAFQLFGAGLLVVLATYIFNLQINLLFYAPVLLRQLLPWRALDSDGYYFVSALEGQLQTLAVFLLTILFIVCWIAIVYLLLVRGIVIYNIFLVFYSFIFNIDLIISLLKLRQRLTYFGRSQ